MRHTRYNEIRVRPGENERYIPFVPRGEYGRR